MRLTETERRLLILAPEVFAVLVLLGHSRPWSQDDIREAVEILGQLTVANGRSVLGFGRMLQRVVGDKA